MTHLSRHQVSSLITLGSFWSTERDCLMVDIVTVLIRAQNLFCVAPEVASPSPCLYFSHSGDRGLQKTFLYTRPDWITERMILCLWKSGKNIHIYWLLQFSQQEFIHASIHSRRFTTKCTLWPDTWRRETAQVGSKYYGEAGDGFLVIPRNLKKIGFSTGTMAT